LKFTNVEGKFGYIYSHVLRTIRLYGPLDSVEVGVKIKTGRTRYDFSPPIYGL
jgi:hypothetical protein